MPTLAEKIKGQRGGGEGRPTNEVFLHPHATYRRCQMKILSAVFQGYVDLDLPVWHLTVISKRWREIAFRTPSLWSKVDIIAVSIHSPTYHFFMDGGRKNFFRGGRHICFDKQSLRILIERSGAAPLDICVECNNRPFLAESRSSNWTSSATILPNISQSIFIWLPYTAYED